MTNLTRRGFVAGGVLAAGAAFGAALRAVGNRFGLIPPDGGGIYGAGETLAYASHRIFGRHAMAREFSRDQISAKPFANELGPPTEEFKRQQAANFANWRVKVEGLVERPQSLSLMDIRAMASSSQITEVTCEEGWSYVAEWKGTPLSLVLNAAGVRPEAKYVVYYSPDPDWYESIDIDEAMHPQTILAYEMNGSELPVPFGGPLRMRVPRQLGYKSVKFINRIVVTDDLDSFPFEGSSDLKYGYAWYAGI